MTAQTKELTANTYVGYKDYVERDLVPVFGRRRLLDLRPKQIEDWVAAQRKAGRVRVTLYQVSTLRNALNHAVRSWRLKFNPAEHCAPPKPRAKERTCWTPKEAAAFLRHNAEQYADQLADLFEVLLGTGMRRGEALALHWSDVHLMDRKLYVRWTLAAIDNGKIHLREPKTEASRAWISLSPRVIAALHRQAAIQMNAHPESRLEGLIFACPSRSPPLPAPYSSGRRHGCSGSGPTSYVRTASSRPYLQPALGRETNITASASLRSAPPRPLSRRRCLLGADGLHLEEGELTVALHLRTVRLLQVRQWLILRIRVSGRLGR
ncbi:tyrosine-type recombinase/integrase [Kitasatospora sp. NPDC004799]|uniref:site-specific integrase n=1 Tax=Kitasatospora sp. NPDC004799 TaxID=3154460 RepID=UPI0033AC4B23